MRATAPESPPRRHGGTGKETLKFEAKIARFFACFDEDFLRGAG